MSVSAYYTDTQTPCQFFKVFYQYLLWGCPHITVIRVHGVCELQLYVDTVSVYYSNTRTLCPFNKVSVSTSYSYTRTQCPHITVTHQHHVHLLKWAHYCEHVRVLHWHADTVSIFKSILPIFTVRLSASYSCKWTPCPHIPVTVIRIHGVSVLR